MKELSVAEVIAIHAEGIAEWGGDGSLRHTTSGGVDGALGSAPYASMQNETGDPDALAYAAGALTYLGRAQHFVDGNKRVAWGSCVRVLEENGFTITASTDEIIGFIEDMVTNKRGVQDVADQLGQWLAVLE